MANYPTFAFFAEMPSLWELHASLGDVAGNLLPHRRAEDAKGAPVTALEEPACIVLSGDLHTIEASGVDAATLLIELSDFPAELYDGGGTPTEAMIAAKRGIALELHRLLHAMGARLSYTSRLDDRGNNDHFGLAERIGRDLGSASRFVGDDPAYFWLYGDGSATAPAERFSPVDNQPRLFENDASRPLFMTLGA